LEFPETCTATPADIILRPEHGVVFDSEGIVDNDMSTWFQTFIVPMQLKAFNKITAVNSLKPVKIGTFKVWLIISSNST
jgi:hypothetical protein